MRAGTRGVLIGLSQEQQLFPELIFSIASRLPVLFNAGELKQNRGPQEAVALTPVGTYRVALNNEISTKRGTERAVIFSTIAIILLLLVAFSRPVIGLLALLPSIVGTMLALFVYSLLHHAITMMAIGFGSAVISFPMTPFV